ncbi:MAG: hypothetical protein JNL24_14000 [Bacteroidia bacterium]|nr:hypothetical protein [Bacteroidia bacterium]
MNSKNLLTITTIGLFITNIVLLWFLVSGRPQHHGPAGGGGPRNIIIEKLKFDKAQQVAFESLIQKHRQDIDRSQAKMIEIKNKLYTTLTNTDNVVKDSLVIKLGNLQKEIETIHYNHFVDIKNLCKPEQKPLFEELSHEIARLFAPPHPPKHKP